jgi:integrase
VVNLADDLLRQAGMPRPSDADMPLLYHALVRSMIECSQAEVRRFSGDWPSLLDPAGAHGMPSGEKAGSEPDGQGARFPSAGVATLSELLRLYHQERKLRPKVHDEMKMLVARFGEVSGMDLPVSKLTKGMVRAFKAAMLAKPRSLSRDDAALPLPDIVEKFANSDVERITAVTVGKAIALLSALTNWGVDNGYLATNPFSGMKPSAVAAEVTRRRSFTAEELARIFGSTIYTGHHSMKRWAEPGSCIVKDARFWLPLLGNYTGCRLEELGQAHVADVRCRDGVLVLNIDNSDLEDATLGKRGKPKEQGGKSVKTESSKRLIPVHPVVLAAGFEAYVQDLRARQEIHLFPDLKPDRYGHRTAAFSKWMARFLDYLGLANPALVFHSFRHGFKSACRRADLPIEVHDYLTGHSSGDVGRRYGEEHLPRIAAALAAVSFPTVDPLFMKVLNSTPSSQRR